MKKIYTALVALVLLPLAMSAQDQTITMTTSRAAGETLSFTVNRTAEDITVDWGDGTAVAYTPVSGALREISGTLKGSTVTVGASSNLQTLICEGCDLTALDVTKAAQLKSLYCSHNAITALNVRNLKQLQDLDVSYNALSALAVTVGNNPLLQTLNIAHNNLGGISGTTTGTNYTGAFTNLQYLDMSGNGKVKQVTVTSCQELDYLDISDNAVTRLNLPTTGRFTVIDAAGNQLTALDPTPYTGLLQIDVTGNQLATLDLSQTKVVKDVFAADNELTYVPFTSRASRDTLNICDLRNNRVFFSSLPRSTSKVRYLNVNPQRPFPLTEDMGFKTGSVEVDGVTYTMPYVTQNPSYETRSNTDYIVDLSALRTDGNGNARNVISFLAGGEDGTVLTQYANATKTGDFTLVGSRYTFLTEYPRIVVRLTHSTGFYANYTFYSEPFTINEPTATGIATLEVAPADANAAVYDLQGRRVSNPAKGGVYIIGGRKVLVK
ncbi:MAG: hypothetical protein J6M53_04310 [Bacteroidaceae bacterium]|nr:hypothetical protein [Bacteroidaceae bacterium]